MKHVCNSENSRHPADADKLVRNGALGGDLQTGERQVGKHDVAAAGSCQIEPGPAGAGADIKQAVARTSSYCWPKVSATSRFFVVRGIRTSCETTPLGKSRRNGVTGSVKLGSIR